jgi:hypothetical protein
MEEEVDIAVAVEGLDDTVGEDTDEVVGD